MCVNGVNVACSEKRFEWSVKIRKALYKYKSIYHLQRGERKINKSVWVFRDEISSFTFIHVRSKMATFLQP